MNFVATWNIHDEDDKNFDLANRTNNTLERYNRSMNDKFPTPHPTLLVFFQTIELKSREQVERCDNIRMGRMRVPQLQETNIGPIPFIYTTFQNCFFV